MIVWRSHRLLLRHRICLPYFIPVRQTALPAARRPTSTFRTLRPRLTATAAARSRDASCHQPFVPPADKANLSSWIDLIEPHLPATLRNPSQIDEDQPPRPTDASISSLGFIISQARKISNHDLLVYLALHQGRWEAMLWITQVLIESCSAPRALWFQLDGLSTLAWPADQRLDHITRTPFYHDNEPKHPLSHGDSLRNIASSDASIHTDFAQTEPGLLLGQVWQSLGRLVIEAANREPAEQQFIMTHVRSILASLNKRHFIPDAIYSSTPNHDPSALGQPQFLYDLSREMLISLSDTVQDGAVPDLSLGSDSVQPLGSAEPSGLLAQSGRLFGPELWLEFILWCCVHGQWLLEGASIIAVLRKVRTPNRWSLICSRDQGKAEWRSPNAERTISAEVVIALIDGLMSAFKKAGTQIRPSMTNILDKISVLKRVLDRDNMSLGVATWDAIISRFADSPALFSMERNPGMMEVVLELAETYGKEPMSRNAALSVSTGLANPTSYVFDGSAAVIGLYHRTLHAYIRARDIDGALRVLGRLQGLTDANKAKSLKEFVARLTRSSATEPESPLARRRWLRRLFPGVEFPAYFSEIPIVILADLLDLMVECGNLELGNWMVSSEDVDGPLIPESIYADQVIAPSLIRLAAVANDKELLSKLSRAQGTKLSGKTLVALCDNRIQNGNFSTAMDILRMVKEHLVYEWKVSDLTTLVKSLFLQIYGQNRGQENGQPASRQAAAFLQRLLRGDLGPVWGASFAQLDTVVGILSSLDPYLSNLCSNVVTSGAHHRIDLPTRSFNDLLEGITRVWGSRKGKEIYCDWCSYNADRHISDLTGFNEETTEPRPNVSELFSVQKEVESPEPQITESRVIFRGEIQSDIATVRIIIQEALREAQKERAKQSSADNEFGSPPKDEGDAYKTLQWAQKILIDDFKLSEASVDYELQGFFSSDQHGPHALDLYSRQTLQIWRAFAGTHREWALARENDLRLFAASKPERYMIFDPVPPQERFLLYALAEDYGLMSESYGDEPERSVKVSKSSREPRVPVKRIDEVLARGKRR